MEQNNLLYYTPEISTESSAAPVQIRQAIKAMIFGIVALSFSEVPFLGFFITPIFAIISLCMRSDFKKKHPGHASGFLKAAKITSIVSFPMCAVSSILCLIQIITEAASSYYYY